MNAIHLLFNLFSSKRNNMINIEMERNFNNSFKSLVASMKAKFLVIVSKYSIDKYLWNDSWKNY